MNFWGVFDDGDKYAPLIAKFQQEYLKQRGNPKVIINYKKFDYGTYRKDLKDAWSAGQGPDIFMIHNTWLPTYEQYIAPYNQIRKNDMNIDL